MSIVGSTRLDRVHETKLRENYALILQKPAPASTEEAARDLERHFEKSVQEKDRVQCDVCMGWSDENLASCPYCNDEGPEPAKEASATVADEGVVIDASAIEAAGVPLEEPKSKGKKGKKSKEEVAETRAPKPMPEMVKPSAPVIDVPLAPVIANEKELDDALERYRKAGQIYGAGSYMMAVEIAKIHDHLWQQRLEGGKAKYKSWAQFVQTELGISVPYANRLRAIAGKFSKNECESYGVKMLMVIASAPKEDHAQLMAKAGDGASTREIDAEVRRIREEKGIAVVDAATDAVEDKGKKQTQRATEAAATSRARKETAAVSIGLKNETGKVKMFAKPLTDAPHAKAVRATKTAAYDDQPYGKIEGINGVTLYLAIQVSPSGEVEIRYTTEREEDD